MRSLSRRFFFDAVYLYRDWELIQARQVVPPCVTPWAPGTTGPLDIDTNVKSGNRYTTDTDPFPAFTYTSPNLRLSRLASIPIPTTAVVVVAAPLTPAGGFHFFDFDLLEVLGMGTFGKVFRVRHKTTGNIGSQGDRESASDGTRRGTCRDGARGASEVGRCEGVFAVGGEFP